MISNLLISLIGRNDAGLDPMPTNWTAAANGGIVTASSEYNANFPATAVIDGYRLAPNWGAGAGDGRGWNDNGKTPGQDEWIQSTLIEPKLIKTFNLFFIPSSVSGGFPTAELPNTDDSSYASADFDIQYLDGEDWITLYSATGNSYQWFQWTHSGTMLQEWRAFFTATPAGYIRLAEMEAWDD